MYIHVYIDTYNVNNVCIIFVYSMYNITFMSTDDKPATTSTPPTTRPTTKATTAPTTKPTSRPSKIYILLFHHFLILYPKIENYVVIRLQ